MSKYTYEYKYDIDDKIELDAIKQFKISELMDTKNKLIKQENAIKAVKSVLLLKECVKLYEECLNNISDGNIDKYNTNKMILEKKLQLFKSDQFIRHENFRLGILQKIYPTYEEDELIEKAQVFQTGDFIPIENLPHRLTELLSKYPKNKIKDKRSHRRSQSHPYLRTSAKGKKKEIKNKEKN